MFTDLMEEEEMANSLPEAALAMFRLMLDLLAGLNGKIAEPAGLTLGRWRTSINEPLTDPDFLADRDEHQP